MIKIIKLSLLLFLVSLIFAPQFLDYDFWWHLRLGEDIYRWDFTNNLTYTCKDYIWVNHSWLTDLLMYVTKSQIGSLGLFLFFGLIVATAFLLIFRKLLLNNDSHKLRLIKVTFAIVSFYISISIFLSPRPQLISFLFAAVFILLLDNIYREAIVTKRIYIALIFLMVIWSSLHGGFLLGYALIAILIFSLLLRKLSNTAQNNFKKISLNIKSFKKEFYLTISLITSFIFSLINPFGMKIWEESLRNITSDQGKYIKEWQAYSFDSIEDFFLVFLIISTSIFLIRNFKRSDLFISIIYIGFLIAFLFSTRYLLFAIIPIMMVLSHLLSSLRFDENKFKSEFSLIYYLAIFAAVLLLMLLTMITWQNLNVLQKQIRGDSETSYPKGAIEYLKSHFDDDPNIKIYNDYHWGGYLSYMLREFEWFADGRMAIWQCYENEGVMFINDLIELSTLGNDWNKLLDKYNFDLIITGNTSTFGNAIENVSDYELVYSDEVTRVFRAGNGI